MIALKNDQENCYCSRLIGKKQKTKTVHDQTRKREMESRNEEKEEGRKGGREEKRERKEQEKDKEEEAEDAKSVTSFLGQIAMTAYA